MISNLQQTVLEAINQNSEQNMRLLQQQSSAAHSNPSESGEGGGFRSWSWKGRFHPVPQDFHFPADNMSNMWHLWWDGRSIDRIAPFRKFEPYDLDDKNMRNRFLKARKVMTFVISHCGTSEAKIQYLPNAYASIFSAWYGDSSEALLDRRTLSTMSYLSFYEIMKGGGRRKKYGGAERNRAEDV